MSGPHEANLVFQNKRKSQPSNVGIDISVDMPVANTSEKKDHEHLKAFQGCASASDGLGLSRH